MTKEMLDKGLSIQAEIESLQHFVDYCQKCWKILYIRTRTRRRKKIRLETSYGILADEIIVSTELADRILNTIEEYIAEKEKELESL